ncbi:uncharacterized protein TNCV_303781 [Trichonephila clavipes]|nr:uncharacterized protein TNCV_303781 [Trichonephila clavipes]
MSTNPVPLKTYRVGQQCTLNLLRAETSSSWCGMVVRRGSAAQVSSTSLDQGSKLRGPSPKALNSATLIFTHSLTQHQLRQKNNRKASQRLSGLESLCDKKGVVSYEDLLIINGTKYSVFREAAGLEKSEDFINEVLDDAA